MRPHCHRLAFGSAGRLRLVCSQPPLACSGPADGTRAASVRPVVRFRMVEGTGDAKFGVAATPAERRCPPDTVSDRPGGHTAAPGPRTDAVVERIGPPARPESCDPRVRGLKLGGD